MAGKDAPPEKFFALPEICRLSHTFYFYAFGNTPPSDLLQHIPHDAARADILSLGCGDLRNFLYSIQLHGRRGVSCGPVPRQLTFTLNDWEPAIHARNLVMLQLVLDSRVLLETASAETGMLDSQLKAMSVSGSEASKAPVEVKIGETPRPTNATMNCNANNAKASSRAGPACSNASGGREKHNAAFAQRIGVIFSAMYNVFVDADVLQTIQEVAGRLAVRIASSEVWNSTELGRMVRFTDDRSQNRVRDILTLYADTGLQGRCSAASVRQQRSTDISIRFSKQHTLVSRAMGLASLRRTATLDAYSEMAHTYLEEGVLDPFPLLLEVKGAPLKRAPCNLVNPLLLVTEKKGISFTLHYASFPLDAFHTEVASWKLRDESTQEEHGNLAPGVLKQKRLGIDRCKVEPTTAFSRRGIQDAWFGAALEQLAQMCGGFLAATSIMPTERGVSLASVIPHLRININVGGAIEFCDAMLAASMTGGGTEGGTGLGADSLSSPTFNGIAFPQGSLQPLRLRKDTFQESHVEFDVISTSNLADNLGTVNLLVASAPLRKKQSHAAIVMDFMSSAHRLHLFKDTAALHKKLFCMSSQAAAILIGVVPVSSMSSVEGHADTTSLVVTMGSNLSSKDMEVRAGYPRMFRVTWKQPGQAFAETASPSGLPQVLGDIGPDEFADLTLPVYNAMMNLTPSASDLPPDLTWETVQEVVNEAHINTLMTFYTVASFGRLLALACRRLRLQTQHFETVLGILGHASPINVEEKMALFHVLGLAPVSHSSKYPPGIRRVVLLVPPSELSLLRGIPNTTIYMRVWDSPYKSVHTACVRVRRGGSGVEEDGNDWNSLSEHLEVRDTREDDPDAELMVSVVMPASIISVMLDMAPSSAIEVQLRCEGRGMFQPPQGNMGNLPRGVIYSADLANTDRTAIMTADRPYWRWKGGSSCPPLVCQGQAVSSRRQENTPVSSVTGRSLQPTPEWPFLQRFRHGKSVIDQSLELKSRPGRKTDGSLMGRVKLVMVNREAREQLAKGGIPHVEATQDPCSVRVVLGEALVHTTCLPFPVTCKDVRVVYTKSQGYAYFVLLPIEGLLEIPFTLTACNIEEDGPRRVLSTLCWPMSVPLAYLPRLDFKAEWAHHEVMGPMSAHTADRSSQEKSCGRSTAGPHMGFRGMKESLLDIATSACATYKEENPVWKHSWACITNKQRQDEPALWVWMNEILLDPSNQALVLDCCIMPVDSMDHEASLQLGAAIGDTATHFIQVCPEEFELWTALLPVAVERARQTYAHASPCVYSTLSYAIPSKYGPTICSCGSGKDLPPTFIESMKCAKGSAAILLTHVYRAALSPLYAPLEAVSAEPAKMTASVTSAFGAVRCAKCGKGGASMRCSRCRKVTYCSRECQRQDWKTHKPTCAAGSGAGGT